MGKSDSISDALDIRDFRQALGSFLTGVTVVTTVDGTGAPRGFTANSFTSVSLEPPLVLVCIDKRSSSAGVFEATGHFAVNILSEAQRDVSSTFAARGVDRFEAVDWQAGPLGDPIVEGCTAWFECSMHDRVEAGDHIILIGRVRAYHHTTTSPLGYCRGTYVSFHLEQDVVAWRHRRTRVGALLESAGRILFRATEDGKLTLPCGRALGSASEPDTLHSNLAALGIEYDLDFLYSVYEEDSTDTLHVFYRGMAMAVPSRADIVGFAPEDIPLDRLQDETIRKLVRRYARERLQLRYSVYAGNETGIYKSVTD